MKCLLYGRDFTRTVELPEPLPPTLIVDLLPERLPVGPWTTGERFEEPSVRRAVLFREGPANPTRLYEGREGPAAVCYFERYR